MIRQPDPVTRSVVPRTVKRTAKPPLGEMVVVFTFWKGDTWLAVKHLEWMSELDANIPYHCVLACDNETDPKPVKELAELLFKSVEMCRYPRATFNGQIIEQWPWQQNNSFANVARFMEKRNSPWLWIETDCTAMRPYWAQIMNSEYKKGGKPFGGHWNYAQSIFNGVAIYPPKVSHYTPQALMATMTVNQDGKQNPWDAECSAEVYPSLHVMNKVMQHLWCLPHQTIEQAPTFPTYADVEKWVCPDIAIFHRCKDGTLIDRMREARRQGYQFKFVGTPSTKPGRDNVPANR